MGLALVVGALDDPGRDPVADEAVDVGGGPVPEIDACTTAGHVHVAGGAARRGRRRACRRRTRVAPCRSRSPARPRASRVEVALGEFGAHGRARARSASPRADVALGPLARSAVTTERISSRCCAAPASLVAASPSAETVARAPWTWSARPRAQRPPRSSRAEYDLAIARIRLGGIRSSAPNIIRRPSVVTGPCPRTARSRAGSGATASRRPPWRRRSERDAVDEARGVGGQEGDGLRHLDRGRDPRIGTGREQARERLPRAGRP